MRLNAVSTAAGAGQRIWPRAYAVAEAAEQQQHSIHAASSSPYHATYAALLLQVTQAAPPIARTTSVRRYRDDNDLIRRINVEDTVLEICKNPLPNDR